MTSKLKEQIKTIGIKYNITQNDQLALIFRALQEKNDEFIEDIFTSKKWKAFKEQLNQGNQKKSVLHFRFPINKQIKNNINKVIKAVIMGPCGNGKTCLVNNLCGSDLPSGQTATSLTRNITEIRSQFQYPIPFIIYDTPGTTAHTDKLQHATHLKCLLEYKPINAVCILIKFDGRYDELISNIFRQVRMLENYKNNIIFLISHFDLAQKPQLAIDQIDKMMKQLDLNNQIVYFSNKFINERIFSDALYTICSNISQVKIKIDMKIFYKYFNLKKQDTEELIFKKCQKQLMIEMEQIQESYRNFATSLPNNQERDAIFQDMEAFLKKQLHQTLQQFVQKYKTTMAATQYFTSYFTLQLKILQLLKQFQDKIRSLQKYYFIESQATGSKLDIRDLIKQCPNPKCKLIWFRIEACPNTTCGNRPSCCFDFMKKTFFRYTIIRDKKSKKIKIQKAKQNLSRKDPTNNTVIEKMTIQQRVKKDKLGCNQTMNFEILPRLPNIEQILMEWYNVNTMQEVIKRFQQDEQIEKTRKDLEKKVNTSFFSCIKF